ncbi:MAG: acyl-CoA dehydrogenase [Comamonadaceae bacterium]|nr:MAG: acyl-CoA dehydrogenase [Comamonadaceae bacterium]
MLMPARESSAPSLAGAAGVGAQFKQLLAQGAGDLPLPGAGQTLSRWRALAEVASQDLSLAKLFEGHTDALAIQRELGADPVPPGSSWGTWAAEPPDAKVLFIPASSRGEVILRGKKAWCSGAEIVSHGLLTVWGGQRGCEGIDPSDGPWLARVDMRQPGVRVSRDGWVAVGMSDSASVQVEFDGARAQLVGEAGDYLRRPGFWQGGAGIAACWWGGARALASALHAASNGKPDPFRLSALGKIDLALAQTAAVLREAAAWIDANPQADASAVATRARLSAEAAARVVLDEAGRSLGAGPFCRDADFARMAADLPVFVRQSHAERDFAFLGGKIAALTAAGTATGPARVGPWSL